MHHLIFRDFEDMVSMNHQLESNLCQVKDEFTRQSTELGDLKEAHTQILDMHSSSKAEVANLQQTIRYVTLLRYVRLSSVLADT